MSLEAIAARLGHRSMRMTMVYARIANRTVADEYFTVSEKVEALWYSTSATSPPAVMRWCAHDLARDAEWLAALLVRLLPDEPEPLGLLALMRLHLARWPARLDARGRLVLLDHQDRSRWDRPAIAAAVR